MLTVFLVWVMSVIYIIGGISLSLLVFNKTRLNEVNDEGSLMKMAYQMGKKVSSKDPQWFTDWVSIIILIHYIILWPIVLPMQIIIYLIKVKKRSIQ